MEYIVSLFFFGFFKFYVPLFVFKAKKKLNGLGGDSGGGGEKLEIQTMDDTFNKLEDLKTPRTTTSNTDMMAKILYITVRIFVSLRSSP